MEVNTIGLPDLNEKILNAIFDNVYARIPGSHDLNDETRKLLQEPIFKDMMDLLLSMQEFNYTHRRAQLTEMYDMAHQIIDFEINSDGTSLWLALMLAIKELYELKNDELKKVVNTITIRK